MPEWYLAKAELKSGELGVATLWGWGLRASHQAPVATQPGPHHLLPKCSRLYHTSLWLSLGKHTSAPDWWPWRFSGCAATHIQSTDSWAHWQDRGQNSRAKRRLLMAFWNKKVGSFILQLIIDMKWVPKFKVNLCIFKNDSMLIFIRYSISILMIKLFVATSWNTDLNVFSSGVLQVSESLNLGTSLSWNMGTPFLVSMSHRCLMDNSTGGAGTHSLL